MNPFRKGIQTKRPQIALRPFQYCSPANSILIYPKIELNSSSESISLLATDS